MDLNSGRRKHRRFVYGADISHDLLTNNNIYSGKLYNFSQGGLYFESDQNIFPGEEIFLKFEDQQNSIKADMETQLPFGVEIVWQHDLPDGYYRFGYGAKYVDVDDSLVKSVIIPAIPKDILRDINQDTEIDPREYPRRQYHKSLRLSYKRKNYIAEFKNISSSGVFVKTDVEFGVGKQIRLVIPSRNIRNNLDLKGWIVRITTDGFAVKFDIG